MHVVSQPSRRVRADFCEVLPDGSALLLAIADVEGESLPTDRLAVLLRDCLGAGTAPARPVAEVVARLNVQVCRSGESPQPLTSFFLARVDSDLRLAYTNAGHNPPLLLRADGTLELLLDGGTLLGAFEPAPYVEASVTLAVGDRLVLYTDGLPGRQAPGGARYGVERLIAALRRLDPQLPAREAATAVLEDLEAFAAGVEPGDDQTLVVLSVRR